MILGTIFLVLNPGFISYLSEKPSSLVLFMRLPGLIFYHFWNFFLVCRICFWTHFAFIEFKLIRNYKLLTKIFETKIKLKNDLFCQHYSFSQFQFNVWTFFLYARRFDLNKATNQIASFYLASYTVCILVLTDEWRLEGLFLQGKLKNY